MNENTPKNTMIIGVLTLLYIFHSFPFFLYNMENNLIDDLSIHLEISKFIYLYAILVYINQFGENYKSPKKKLGFFFKLTIFVFFAICSFIINWLIFCVWKGNKVFSDLDIIFTVINLCFYYFVFIKFELNEKD